MPVGGCAAHNASGGFRIRAREERSRQLLITTTATGRPARHRRRDGHD
jgi:hypothetical protein